MLWFLKELNSPLLIAHFFNFDLCTTVYYSLLYFAVLSLQKYSGFFFRIVEIVGNYTVLEQSLQRPYWHVWSSVRQWEGGRHHRVPVCPTQYPRGVKLCCMMFVPTVRLIVL